MANNAKQMEINGVNYEFKDADARGAIEGMQEDLAISNPVIASLIDAKLNDIERIHISFSFGHRTTQYTAISDIELKQGDMLIGVLMISERSYTDHRVSLAWAADRYDSGSLTYFVEPPSASGAPRNVELFTMIQCDDNSGLHGNPGYLAANVGGPGTVSGGGPGVTIGFNGWLLRGAAKDSTVIDS